jgi:hypothetical protein
MFWGIMWEMIDHQFNSTFLEPYMQRLRATGAAETQHGSRGGFIDQRASQLRNAIRGFSSATVALSITTNGGENFVTADEVVRIEGRAPVDITDILVSVNGVSRPGCERADFSTADSMAWFVDLPLGPGFNEITVIGFNISGENLGSDLIGVSRTDAPPPVIERLEPAGVDPGEWFSIHGTGLHFGAVVRLGGRDIAEVDCSGAPARIAARVPPSTPSGSYDVVVVCPELGQSNALTLVVLGEAREFLRGDVDHSGRLNVTDAVRSLLHLFGGEPLACTDAADLDDSGRVNLSDPVYLLDFLFRQGPAPQPPFPSPGSDPTPDALECPAAKS